MEEQVATRVRERLDNVISRGMLEATQAIETLKNSQPTDYLVPAAKMSFVPSSGGGTPRLAVSTDTGASLHQHAFKQVLAKGDVTIPYKFASDILTKPYGSETLVDLLNKSYKGLNGDKFLVRTVGTEVRGFLSDKFRRMDSYPLIESFVEASKSLGAVPVEAKFLPTNFSLKMMIPKLYEPARNEVVGVGVAFYNSDFGDGAYWVRSYILRLLCYNGMIGESLVRKVHLGSRIENVKGLSDQTLDLDFKTIASATRDMVNTALSPEVIEHRMSLISKAASETINADSRVEAMYRSSRITKEEMENVKKKFSSAEVELLPPGNTAWRLGNALSLLAQEVKPERSLDLQRLAGEATTAFEDC